MRRTRKENEMAKNLLLEYSEELATRCELLCKSISGNSNTVFQLRKSSSSVFANITEAQYPQSLADMLSKFKIARKECAETESWLKLLYNTKTIDEETFKTYRNLCGRIQRMLTSSCITIMIIGSRNSAGWHYFEAKSLIWQQIFGWSFAMRK